jgi:hypothetical protein
MDRTDCYWFKYLTNCDDVNIGECCNWEINKKYCKRKCKSFLVDLPKQTQLLRDEEYQCAIGPC